MTKIQLKTLATKTHGLAVKSANGKKTVQGLVSETVPMFDHGRRALRRVLLTYCIRKIRCPAQGLYGASGRTARASPVVPGAIAQ
jgi:hypothetical protein